MKKIIYMFFLLFFSVGCEKENTPIKSDTNEIGDISNDSDSVFGFTFGTKRNDMDNFIQIDYSPSISLSSYSNEKQPFSLFGFYDDKLVKLYAVCELDGRYYINNIIKKYKAPTEINFKSTSARSSIVENPQEWVVGKLKIKVFNSTFNELLGTSADYRDIEMAFLTIEYNL